MANDLTGSPMRIDTFGADVDIKASGRTLIKNITVTAYTSAKTITFIDADAANVLVLECPAGETISWPMFDDKVLFDNGLTFDDSESDLAAGDFIFIWKK